MASEPKSASIVIRSFQPSDQAGCEALFKLVHSEYGNPTAYINYALHTDMADIPKRYLGVPDGHWWVAVSTDDNRIVGHLAVLPLQVGDPSYYAQAAPEERDHICELLRMAIDPSVQRQGLGGRLLSTLIDFVRERGYRQIHSDHAQVDEESLCILRQARLYQRFNTSITDGRNEGRNRRGIQEFAPRSTEANSFRERC